MESIREGLAEVVAFIPALISGLVVLAIGWVIAKLVSMGLRRVLPRFGFDGFLARHRLANRTPGARPASAALATAVAWVIFLVALMQAASIWGLSFIATGLSEVIAYLPNVVAAMLIFGAALLVGNWVADRLRSSLDTEREGSNAPFLAGAVRAAILTVGGFIALRQLQLATEILVIGFSLVFGAIAVAVAIAFGLGGRKAAEQMTVDWYDRQPHRRHVKASRRHEPVRPSDEEPVPH